MSSILRLALSPLRKSYQCAVALHKPIRHDVLRFKSGTVLSRSTVLVQDGLDIRELPWIVRRMDPSEYPFSVASYSAGGESVHKLGAAIGADEAFRQLLLECSTVHQVIKRLEVPGEQVTVHSAAFALKRICQLREKAFDDVDSFIKKAILHELCETVARGVTSLSNDDVISLLRCFLVSPSYEDRFIDQLNNEIDRRIGDCRFTMQELCSLIVILSENSRGDVSVTSNVWTHLASRYMEIDSDLIGDVYRCMVYITPTFRYVWSVLDKQLQGCWWKLGAADVSSIAVRLTVAGHRSVSTLSCLSKWLFSNVHTVNDSQLKDLLALYAHFDFSDARVMSALERYITAKISKMDRTLVAMAMDYCRQKRFLSVPIMDAVARDFINHYQSSNDSSPLSEFISNCTDTYNTEFSSKNDQESSESPVQIESIDELEKNESTWVDFSCHPYAEKEVIVENSGGGEQLDYNSDITNPYEHGHEPFPSSQFGLNHRDGLNQSLSCTYAPHELVLTLRAYGVLNYLPPNSSDFFKAVERALVEHFSDISAGGVLDLLTSFVYLERFPVNFVARVFTPHFLAKVKAIKDPSPRLRASRCLLQLQAAIFLEFPSHPYIERLDRSSLNISLTWLEGRNFRFHQEMAAVLRQLIGPNFFIDVHLPNNTPHMIDFVLITDSEKKLLKTTGHDKSKPTRLAIVGLMPEHYCINSQHLLGEQHTKLRHLRLLGYNVIQIDYETFMWKCRGASARTELLKSALSNHIKLELKS